MCLAFTMLPTLANAFEIGEYIYTVTDSVKRTVSLNTKHPSYMTTNVNITGNVNIPSKVEYDGVEYTVTAIENDAFCYFKRVTSVTIPNTVTSIGDNSFAYCENLVDITIPNSVISIGENAFAHCTGLSSITIPNSVTTIGINAFFNCYSLTEVNIPNSVKTIGNGAFQRCMGLTSVTIPNSITSLEGVFIDCTGLTSVTIPNSVTSMNRTFSGCTGLSSVVIPNSVTSMDETFVRCTKLTSITIPNSVTSMDGTFSGCTGLTSVVIPNSVTSMNGTFFNCTGLTSVVIPNSVTSMNGTFSGCTGLTSANIPDSVTTINSAFRECTKLTNITIPSSVTSMEYAFYGCSSLTSIEIPNNVTSIKAAFCGCTGLTSVIIPKSVTSIGDFTFEGCSQLTSVEIPESVTSIESSAFNGCSQLASIEIPEAVSLIGYNAFRNCKSLPELIIPDSVATIRDYAFSGTECTVYYGGKATGGPWGAKKLIRGSVIDGDFVYADKQKTKLVAYLGSDSVVTIPDNVKTIAEKIFYNNTGLTSVVIPESVTSIEKQAFYGCTGLKSIVIPDSVSTIGDEAFYSVKRIYYGGAATRSPWGANFHVRGSVFCGDFVYADEQKTKLVFYNGTDSVVTIPDHVRIIGERAFIGNIGITSVSIPDSVTTIETSAFYGCENLTSVNMPSALTTIGDYAFETCQNCRTFSDIILPNSVTSIGRSAFSRVERLYYAGTATGSSWGAEWHIRGNVFDGDFVYADEQKTILAGYIGSDSIVDIPNQVKTIGIGAFLQNQKLYSVNMSNSVVSIEEAAFRECPNLTYVTLSDSITSIGTYAFFNNKKLTSVTIPESVTTIETCAFDNCKGLSSVIVPNSLASIGSSAFRNIDTIYFAGNSPGSPWGAKKWVRGSVFDGDFVYSDEQKENLVFYRGNDSVVIISDQVKVIGEYAFYNNKKLSNVIFPDSLTSIKNYAFDGCVLLSSVSVPNDVNAIGTYAFRGTDTLYYGGSATGSPWGARRYVNPNFLERDDDGFYLIHNGAELAKFRDVVNDGATTINGRLANDIDLSEECKDSVWIPIGVYKNEREYIHMAYEGVFDGAGHSIEHLYNTITSSGYEGNSHKGLFAYTKNATIKNVVVKNSSLTAYFVAAIVAVAENTTIVNCGSEAKLYGPSDHGAAPICAISEGCRILNCYNIGDVKCEYNALGFTNGGEEIINCYTSCVVLSEGGSSSRFGDGKVVYRCFADTVLSSGKYDYENKLVTMTSTDYIKSDAFLADMNAWVDSMNATQSEIVFARWVRDEVDGYPKLQPTHTSVSLPDVHRTTPDGISVYAVEGTIYIRSAHAGKATLYDLHGRAVASVAYTEGLTMVDGLREGVYIVCGVKVIVRRGK